MADTEPTKPNVDVEEAVDANSINEAEPMIRGEAASKPPMEEISLTNNNGAGFEEPSTTSKPEVEKPKASANAASKPSNRKWLYITGIVLAIAVLVFVIVFPIVWTQCRVTDESSPSSSTSNVEGEATTGSAGDDEAAFKTIATGAGPFNSTLSLFTPDITEGYSSVEELREDIEQAAWFFLNQVVKRNTENPGFGSGAVPRDGYAIDEVSMDKGISAPEVADSMPMPSMSPPAAGEVASDLNDFGTNNQERDVEEGDVVVSDGKLVYAAYGDYLVIWNAGDGTLVAKIKMPDVKEMMPNQGNASASAPDGGYYYYPKPTIQALVLHEGRLLVIVDGYGSAAQLRAGKPVVNPVIYDYLSTHVRLYNTADLANGIDNVLGTTDVHGRFSGVRSIDGNAHVMTVSDVHAYTYLDTPFSRWNFPWLTTNEEYIAHVYKVAKEQAVPFFVEELVKELVPDGTTLPNIARISLWQTENSGTSLEQRTFSDGILNSLAQVHSMEMMSNENELGVSSSGAFLPSSWAQFYGATNALIIAGQGWNYVAESGSSNQATYFLGFSVDGASTSPRSVGRVDGYLLNNHAIDVVGNVLRVATSIQNSWSVRPVVSEDTSDNSFVIEEVPSSTQNYVIMLEMPGMDGAESGVMEELGRLKLGKPNELFTAVRFFDNIAYAVTFERRDPLYVLDLAEPSEPIILAELNVTGFSSYLHSMNDDNTLLLAIGQEADDAGTILGIQFTVFDVRDPSNPFAAVRHTLEQSNNTFSYSGSLDDFKATRYAGERLIVPIDVWGYEEGQESFHGFVTYFVNATTIQKECSIQDGQEQAQVGDGGYVVDACYYCAQLPARSMIFDGNLMTMKNHFIRSNNMNTCQQVWALDIVIDDTVDGCCGAFW